MLDRASLPGSWLGFSESQKPGEDDGLRLEAVGLGCHKWRNTRKRRNHSLPGSLTYVSVSLHFSDYVMLDCIGRHVSLLNGNY